VNPPTNAPTFAKPWLKHRSKPQRRRLGVASSNLAAPTNKIRRFLHFQMVAVPRKIALGNAWGTAAKLAKKL
jgi:hypothetical protein